MTRRRKTDGENVANATEGLGLVGKHYLADRIDRLIRKRMGEAWEEGWFDRDCQEADWDKNPYRGGRRKK